ncbi:eukaryotic translation initiation factor 4 gamma 1 isoform X2 [Octopus vulgaris]|uniref:Eukaryotic translation initiation factor 4 gamma 1 isoform X2 n=1 Tax=Octopus vulgaris TaxID=6645 RepID=A0AA36FIY8_OCTVU|nr:eukaryotic translation initiation factor 4 gamma 1 isoform X2 [Octopus vulgaris]
MKFIRCNKDQWNDTNPTDLKQYDRDTLLGLQNASASLSRPENLPDLPDVILSAPLTTVAPGVGIQSSGMTIGLGGDKGINTDWRNGNDPFIPFYVKSARSSVGGVTKRGSQQGKKEVKNIIIQIPKEVKLKTCENAWLPSAKKPQNTVDDSGGVDAIVKRVRSILNKLTPQNFETLVDQMELILIDTEDKLGAVTDLVFEKAVLEPNYSSAYAKFCTFLMMLKVPSKNNPEKNVDFHSLLLTKCRQQFEKDNESEQNILDLKEKIEAANEEEKKVLLEDLDTVMFISRRKSVGNIRFIGELFKMNMVKLDIMHGCLERLSSSTDEEKLECMCKLLSTVGKVIECKAKNEEMNRYFKDIRAIVGARETSSRIRFMLLDLIDLRKNKWVPRHAEKGPKTLKELHQDIENEEIEHRLKMDAAAANQHQLSSYSSQRNRGGRAGSMGPLTPPQANDSDGWNTVGGGRTLRAPIDPSKMWLPKSKNDDSIQLCPSVGSNKFGMWGRGSTGGGSSRGSNNQQNDRLTTTPTNRFSALCGDDEDLFNMIGSSGQENRPEMFARGGMGNRRSGSRSGVGPSPGQSGRNQFSGFRGKALPRRFSQEDRNVQRRGSNDNLTPLRGQTREDSRSRKIRSRENSRNRSMHTPIGSRESSQNRQSVLHSRENSRDSKMASCENGMFQENKPLNYDTSNSTSDYPTKHEKIELAAAQSKPISEAEVKKKTMFIIDGYLNNKDLEEVVVSLSKLKSSSNLQVFISSAISHVLDLTQPARTHTGSLIYHLMDNKTISKSDFLNGMNNVLEYAEDLEIDVPRIWTYFAQLISSLLGEGRLPWTILKEIVEPLKTTNKGGVFIAEILKELVTRMGEQKVQELWKSFDLKLSDFYKAEDMSKFISDHKLEFMFDKDNPDCLLNDFENKLHNLLETCNLNNKPIFDLIEELQQPLIETEEFIRILMTEICSSAIVESKVSKSKIKTRCEVLLKYLGQKPNLQLQALYSLQALDVKLVHPPSVLRMMFETLYDEDVIAEDAYFQWEKSEDSPGKGVALKQVAAFLTWLHEAEEDDD